MKGSKFKRKNWLFVFWYIRFELFEAYIKRSSLMGSWYFGFETLEIVIIVGLGSWSLVYLVWVILEIRVWDWILRGINIEEVDREKRFYIKKWEGELEK